MPSLISIIVPAYNERENVEELARRLGLVFAERLPGYAFEAIIVENGSADDTWEKLEGVHLDDPRFKAVQLARNFRMDGGITAGLQYATGDAAVIMTADLQDPPEVIPEFVAKWEEGYENVYGIVTERQGTGPIRRLNSEMFYWLAGKLTGEAFPRNASDFRLVDRRVYEAVRNMDERNRFLRGLFAWVGFRSIGVPHARPPRVAGVSNAHTFKVLDLALKGIFAHSYVLLKLISLVGLTLSALSAVALVMLTVRFILFGVPFAGFGTIVCLVILLFGFLFTMLGVMSEYVGLIYEEVKQRPNFVVRQTLGTGDPRTGRGPLEGGAAVSRGEPQRSS
ncbi:MAG: glycosyltransferase family 2 protein [Chloroflexota bacterium]|nr:glycosyltransferase family 2 protein [Chloroflexota bacterium]